MSNISYYAIITIVKFRINEFFKEYHYTILSPSINTLLFVIIFSTINIYYKLNIDEINFIEFIVPGLILMVVAQESYDNVSNTLVNMKLIGSFDDFLSAPISRTEIFISLIFSSILIGIFLAILNFFILSFFVNFQEIDIKYFLYYIILAIIFFTCLGALTGFLSYTWDTQSTVSSFFVTPLNFLSGTFFSINSLPDNFKFIFEYNPYYYVVKNFRSSFYNNFEYYFYENLTIILFVLFSLITAIYVFYNGFRVIK